MDVLGSAGLVLTNLNLTQNNLNKDVRALASGLRVQNAADDPSGNSIANTLQTRVDGLQQSSQNVQTANNALNVVDGALNSIQMILERVNSLVVESRSDVNSTTDLENIQTEINQLLLEINRIGSNTSFNGLQLLNGNFDATVGAPPGSQPQFTEIASPIVSPSGAAGSDIVQNADGAGNAGPLVSNVGSTAGNFVPALIVFQVIGYSANAVDPDTNTAVGPGVYLQFSAYSTSSALGNAPLYTDISAVPVNGGQITTAQYAAPSNAGFILQNFTLANLTQADVGATIAFISNDPTVTDPSGHGTALTVNDGGQEGTTVSINLPTVSTNTLNVADISVLAPQSINFLNQVTGQDSSNSLSAAYAEIKVGDALQKIDDVRAVIGAQSVALQEDASSADTGVVNYTASESMIRDANIGATVTDYTKNQILTQVGTSVLSHIEINAQALTNLLLNAGALA